MNEEMKETIDRLFVYKNENDEMHYQPEDILTIDDVWLLLDYITNLQEENKKLKELCDKYEEEHKTTFEYWKHLIKEDYKTRIDKAIEYINVINENTPSSTRKDYAKMILINYEILLKILKGYEK